MAMDPEELLPRKPAPEIVIGQDISKLSVTELEQRQAGKVGKGAKISDPSGGATVDAEARTAINSIIDALEGVGITANA